MSDSLRRPAFNPMWHAIPGVAEAIPLAAGYSAHIVKHNLEGALIHGVLVIPNVSRDLMHIPSQAEPMRILRAAQEIARSEMSPESKLAAFEAIFS